MRDRIFYPLAFALAGAFVFMALQPYAERLPSGAVSGGGRNAEDVTISGVELYRFVAGELPGVSIDIGTGPDGAGEVLRIVRRQPITRIPASALISFWRRTSSMQWNRARSR